MGQDLGRGHGSGLLARPLPGKDAQTKRPADGAADGQGAPSHGPHPFAPESVAYPLAGNFCSAQHGRVSDEYDREAVKGGYGGEAAARTGMMISGVDSGRFRWRAAW